MKIENDFQADTTQTWIARVSRHIVDLGHMARASSTDVSDQIVIAERLKEILQASLITYTEERNYGNAPQQSKEETEGRVRESGKAPVANPEGDNPASKRTKHQGKKTEVDHDLSSKSFQSRR
ncbi:hypothetical protein LCGC14_1320020 [marine sediment metagenome]|uniref:Uncharacterized protein n=1 Tax=marine sediment metagenome TaxID=412755 RepID=A0A0F9KKC4_9ZZZZ|nr:hypothetical protein [Candidatus Aminicenantes bacterium]